MVERYMPGLSKITESSTAPVKSAILGARRALLDPPVESSRAFQVLFFASNSALALIMAEPAFEKSKLNAVGRYVSSRFLPLHIRNLLTSSRLLRHKERGRYDYKAVFEIVQASLVLHVAWIDPSGLPRTPFEN